MKVKYQFSLLKKKNESKVSVLEFIKGGYSLSIKILALCKKICWISNVYGPNDYKEPKHLWLELLSLSYNISDPWCMGGDFNIICWAHVRFPLGRQRV